MKQNLEIMRALVVSTEHITRSEGESAAAMAGWSISARTATVARTGLATACATCSRWPALTASSGPASMPMVRFWTTAQRTNGDAEERQAARPSHLAPLGRAHAVHAVTHHGGAAVLHHGGGRRPGRNRARRHGVKVPTSRGVAVCGQAVVKVIRATKE